MVKGVKWGFREDRVTNSDGTGWSRALRCDPARWQSVSPDQSFLHRLQLYRSYRPPKVARASQLPPTPFDCHHHRIRRRNWRYGPHQSTSPLQFLQHPQKRTRTQPRQSQRFTRSPSDPNGALGLPSLQGIFGGRSASLLSRSRQRWEDDCQRSRRTFQLCLHLYRSLRNEQWRTYRRLES